LTLFVKIPTMHV